ncbi:MAG: hypothetical protein KIPDCIKN_02486 [Haliscomenobacter sp.]|nr:hypothetical protein [Haliscomenobacter sp.]
MNQSNRLLWVFLGLAILLLLWRFSAFIRGGIFLLAGLGAVAVLIWGVIDLVRIRNAQRRFLQSPEGWIENLKVQCASWLKQNRLELKGIESNILDLKKAMNLKKGRPDAESAKILQGFEQERQLRLVRIAFFQSCLEKLDALTQRQELARLLEEKKKRLRALREIPLEEWTAEETQSEGANQDYLELENIQSLVQRMEGLSDYEEAEKLVKEMRDG